MNSTRIFKWSCLGLGVLMLLYVGSVVWFEAQLGINQPQGATSIVIATFNEENERHERVVRLETIDDKYYVAANHWPRAWYHQALANLRLKSKCRVRTVLLLSKLSMSWVRKMPLCGKFTALASFSFSDRLSAKVFSPAGTESGLILSLIYSHAGR